MTAYIDLPLVYGVMCKAFRSRYESRVEMMDSVTLPVREVSPDEAPLAVKIKDGDGEGEEHLRWFEDRYWIRDIGQGDASGKLRHRLQLGRKSEAALLGSESLFLIQNFRKHADEFRSGVRRTVDSLRCRDVTSSERDEYVDKIARRVQRDLVMIDGERYMAVGEPVLVLYMDRRQCIATVSLGAPSIDMISYFTFPIDRSDDLRGVMDSAVSSDGLTAKTLVEAEHLYGETTPLMQEKDDLRTIAAACVKNDTMYVTGWTKEKASAWFDLRDALEVATDSMEETAVDKIANAFAAYGEHVEIGPYGRAAIERWHLRAIDVEEPLSMQP